MKVKINISVLMLSDQIEFRHKIKQFDPEYLSESLLIVTFNPKVEELLYEYELHNYEVYK